MNHSIRYNYEGMCFQPTNSQEEVCILNGDGSDAPEKDFFVKGSQDAAIVRIKGDQITNVGWMLPGEETWPDDHPHKVWVMENEAVIVEACKVFLEKHPDGEIPEELFLVDEAADEYY